MKTIKNLLLALLLGLTVVASSEVEAMAFKNTTLHDAVVNDNPDDVKNLLKQGALVDETDGSGHTALFNAIRLWCDCTVHGLSNNYKTIVNSLISYGASLVNVVDNDGNTLLLYVVKRITQESTYAMSLLIIAELLIRHAPFSVDATDNNGNTVLHVTAAGINSYEFIRGLIYNISRWCRDSNKIEKILNEINNDEETPLKLAHKNNNFVTECVINESIAEVREALLIAHDNAHVTKSFDVYDELLPKYRRD